MSNTHPGFNKPKYSDLAKLFSFRGALGYVLVNVCFIGLVTVLSLSGGKAGRDPSVYLCLLFSLAAYPFFFVPRIRGPYIVLLVFSIYFFVMYGLADFVRYFSDVGSIYVGPKSDSLILSSAELVILSGLLSAFLGNLTAISAASPLSRRFFCREWNFYAIVFSGLIFFSVGVVATFAFQIVYNIYDISNSKVDSVTAVALVLGRMLGNLGEILLSYAAVKGRKKIVSILVIALILLKVPLGVVLNSKEIGASFLIIYLIVRWLAIGKQNWMAVLVAFVLLSTMFSFAYEYRAYMDKYQVSVEKTLEDISGHLGRAFDGREESEQRDISLYSKRVMDGFGSLAERVNLKPSVELIVSGVGKDIPYQEGHTLTPMLYILIPRMLMPDKPSVSVGQLFNREFKISASSDTWISVSFLAELYWNFAWLGVIIGMFLFGFTLGLVGVISDVSRSVTSARILMILSTIYLLVLRFEAGMAQQYSLFIRTFIIIALVDFALRRRRAAE